MLYEVPVAEVEESLLFIWFSADIPLFPSINFTGIEVGDFTSV